MIGVIFKNSKSNGCHQDKLSFCDIYIFVMYFSDKEITVLQLNPNINLHDKEFSSASYSQNDIIGTLSKKQ